MAEKRKGEHGLLAMLSQVFNAGSGTPEADIAVEHRALPSGTPREAAVILSRVPEQSAPGKRTVTGQHLQTIILAGLQEIDGFPRSGILVTVYGVRPWNAMITFAPGSASTKDATMYRDVLQRLVAELRKQFDVE